MPTEPQTHTAAPHSTCAQEQWGEAAKKIAELVDDDSFRSLEGKSKHQLWLELCDIITKHPKEVSGLKVDAILRSGIRKFTDEVCYLALHVAQNRRRLQRSCGNTASQADAVS